MSPGGISGPGGDLATRVLVEDLQVGEGTSAASDDEDPPFEYVKPYKNPPDALHPFTKFRMDMVLAQDFQPQPTQC